ncbi:unnamed protein product [Lymnaea stagnalis]|uniref:Uncharacterized protein n=1 Tax=Lymnaea stagnalis TaxID=6523 RepID=A0AAV2IGT1_LYMST
MDQYSRRLHWVVMTLLLGAIYFIEGRPFQCPDTKPHMCPPPSETCYGYDEFCSDGLNTSCFPLKFKDLERPAQIEWCIHNLEDVSKMRNTKCRLACQSRFNFSELGQELSTQIKTLKAEKNELESQKKTTTTQLSELKVKNNELMNRIAALESEKQAMDTKIIGVSVGLGLVIGIGVSTVAVVFLCCLKISSGICGLKITKAGLPVTESQPEQDPLMNGTDQQQTSAANTPPAIDNSKQHALKKNMV